MISREIMSNFEACFDPANITISIASTRASTGFVILEEDFTSCYLSQKFKLNFDGSCAEGAIINGRQTDQTDKISVLFNSDFAQCISDE